MAILPIPSPDIGTSMHTYMYRFLRWIGLAGPPRGVVGTLERGQDITTWYQIYVFVRARSEPHDEDEMHLVSLF